MVSDPEAHPQLLHHVGGYNLLKESGANDNRVGEKTRRSERQCIKVSSSLEQCAMIKIAKFPTFIDGNIVRG